MRKIILPVLLLFVMNCALGQSNLPILRANSKTVSIRDGAFFDKNRWTLNPKLKLDVFTADRTRETKYVTFYTDIDSIRVKVKPGSHFDFVILYNGTEAYNTLIESAIQPENVTRYISSKTDTIPFWLTANNAIAMKALINGTDTLNMHFDFSAFEFRFTKDAIQKKHYSPKLDNIATLQIGKRIWQKPNVGSTGLTARQMDGRIGWDVFDGQIVEINYEQSIMVIHSDLPHNLNGYKRSKLHFIRSYPCIGGTLVANGKSYNSDFLMDTGAESDLIIDSVWVAVNHFPTNLKIVSSTTLRDPRGVVYETRKAEIPGVHLNGFTTSNAQALLLLGSQHPTGFPINLLGNGVLKNYDMIVDFQKDNIYLRPNHKNSKS